MSAISIGSHRDSGAIARLAADWLGLAAAPAFVMMALITAVFGGVMDPLCSAAGVSRLSGMVPMYLMMGAVHLAPWLRLISGRGS
jgi:hypothetical protein